MRKYSTILLVAFSFLLVVNAKAQITSGEYSNDGLILSNLSSMPLAFTENQGQFGEKTLFKAEAGGATFFFCPDEVVYLFVRDTDELIEDDVEGWHAFPKDKHAQVFDQSMPPAHDSRSGLEETRHPRYKKESLLIKAQFIGANPDPEVIGLDRLPHNNNYFLGNDPTGWRTDVPNYSAIIYRDIYPGIDLKYYGDGHSMKYDFIVNPGADMSRIAIRYEGVDDLSISNDGDLQLKTAFGFVYENKPYVYQDIGGRKIEIEAEYYLKEPGMFGFKINGRDPDYPLIIDPELVYSTYLGGSDEDWGNGIAVDGSGNAYVTGRTYSIDFPTEDPYDGILDGESDVYVTKFSPAGNSLIYSTYLGGANTEEGQCVTVDGSGSVYVTGQTSSSDFPTENPFDGSYNGGEFDVFVAKLSPAGNSLIYSTFLGGINSDYGHGIAVDGSGNAYVTGRTNSGDFPTANPYDGSYNGGDNDVFVTKLSAAGNSLAYSTYLGGSHWDGGSGIAVDGSGNAYVTGSTFSSDFPTANPYDGSFNGVYDVFATKLSTAGNSLVYSTYLGGSVEEDGSGIAVDGSGNAYVTGGTLSSDFPTVNPYQTDQGNIDAFATKLAAGGDSIVYSTYLGGSVYDRGNGIAVDGSGNAYVTGFTYSSDFPTANPYQTDQPVRDVFVTKLSAAGNSLVYSTYLGGSGSDAGSGIAVDGSGNAYVTGSTFSSDFPTENPYDGSWNGHDDAFVAKFGPEAEPIPTLSEWGMLIMGLLLLAMGTVAVVRRRKVIVKV